MKVKRIILIEQYTVFKTWWERRGMEPPQELLLPEIGVYAEDNEGLVCCAWLYEEKGGRIAFVEWEATNPDCTPMRAIRGLNLVFDFFETYCRDNSIPVILSWVAASRGDGRLLERRKWKKCPGERHELMAFETVEIPCLQPSH